MIFSLTITRIKCASLLIFVSTSLTVGMQNNQSTSKYPPLDFEAIRKSKTYQDLKKMHKTTIVKALFNVPSSAIFLYNNFSNVMSAYKKQEISWVGCRIPFATYLLYYTDEGKDVNSFTHGGCVNVTFTLQSAVKNGDDDFVKFLLKTCKVPAKDTLQYVCTLSCAQLLIKAGHPVKPDKIRLNKFSNLKNMPIDCLNYLYAQGFRFNILFIDGCDKFLLESPFTNNTDYIFGLLELLLCKEENKDYRAIMRKRLLKALQDTNNIMLQQYGIWIRTPTLIAMQSKYIKNKATLDNLLKFEDYDATYNYL